MRVLFFDVMIILLKAYMIIPTFRQCIAILLIGDVVNSIQGAPNIDILHKTKFENLKGAPKALYITMRVDVFIPNKNEENKFIGVTPCKHLWI